MSTIPASPELSTVNPDEIIRFSRLAEQWWDPAGPMWPLHKLNTLRAPYIADIIRRQMTDADRPAGSLAGLKILDIGCGAGLLSESMAVLGAHVTGVDPTAKNIAIARAHAASTGLDIDYRQGAVEDLPQQQFDVVLNMEVVEHVESLPAFMQACCSLTRTGGLQFVATINRNLLSLMVAIVGAEYVLRWLPRGTHQWRKFVTPAEMASMLDSGQHRIVDRRGVAVNPFTKRYKLTRSDRVNYMLAARKG
jgi:2-polyprenyl-6-hydroxyphenyl methylase/3-demethylubiquinone-9 3-methyltransferase